MDNKVYRRRVRLLKLDPSNLSRPWRWLLAASAHKTSLLLAAGLISLLSGVAIG